MPDEKPWEPLPTERPINEYYPAWQSGSQYLEGIDDWTGIPTRQTVNDSDTGGKRLYKVPERAQHTDKNYLEGIDWKQYDDNADIAEKYPIYATGDNVGQQFIDRVEPLFNAMRRRPLSHGAYSVHLTSAPTTQKPWDNDYEMKLAHNGLEVGHVGWNGHDGHVGGLDVDLGHRHMTAKLLQEAWDLSRKRGHVGPAVSNELSSYSGKIVKKYNPEAYEYRQSEYAEENDYENYEGEREEDDESRWERLSEQAYESHRYEAGEPCTTCEGAGVSRIVPRINGQRGENNTWQRHFTGQYAEAGSQTMYGYDEEGNDHEFEYYHPDIPERITSAENRRFKDLANQGYRSVDQIEALNSSGTMESRSIWEKPCPACSHLQQPGFPNHDDNR